MVVFVLKLNKQLPPSLACGKNHYLMKAMFGEAENSLMNILKVTGSSSYLPGVWLKKKILTNMGGEFGWGGGGVDVG